MLILMLFVLSISKNRKKIKALGQKMLIFFAILRSSLIFKSIFTRYMAIEAKERNEKPELEIATISASVTSLCTAYIVEKKAATGITK